VAFSPDGHYLVSASVDRTVKLWELAGQQSAGIRGHSKEITAVAVSPDGKLLATGSADQTVRLWELATGRELFTLEGHAKDITSVAFLSDSKTLVSADKECTLKLWDTATGKEIRTITNEGPLLDGIPVMTSTADRKQVVAWLAQAEIGTFSVADGKQLESADLPEQMSIKCLSICADGSTAAIGRGDGSVILWDIATKKPIGGELQAHDKKREIHDLALTPDKKTLVTADDAGAVKIWQLPERKLLHTIAAHKREIRVVAMSPDGRRFATVAADNIIKVWDRASGKELRQWDLHLPVLSDPRSFTYVMAFTPDGKQLAIGNVDTTVYLLDCP
ncbi:MAG: WD40 repeat domain-containing protein, partial [Gemmataceae bacterium]